MRIKNDVIVVDFIKTRQEKYDLRRIGKRQTSGDSKSKRRRRAQVSSARHGINSQDKSYGCETCANGRPYRVVVARV